MINNINTYCFLLFFITTPFIFAGHKKNAYLNENRIIFQETLESIHDHPLPFFKISIYEGYQNIFFTDSFSTSHTSITVMNKTSFQVTQELVEEGYKPLILDMANKESPGGSVFDGSKAQEETLCRQSNLYLALKQAEAMRYYPITELGGILIKGVTFFRNDLYEFIEKEFQADVFASAAYDCNQSHIKTVEKQLSGYDKPEKVTDYENGMKAKMRASFRAAKENGNDALVLSAFGCGAFKNDPEIVSQWYKEVLNEKEFLNIFKIVVFAIIPNSSHNFKSFQSCFSENI